VRDTKHLQFYFVEVSNTPVKKELSEVSFIYINITSIHKIRCVARKKDDVLK
jgi:hypothetical protein